MKIFLRMTSLAATFSLRNMEWGILVNTGSGVRHEWQNEQAHVLFPAETHCGIFCCRAEMIPIISTLTSLISPGPSSMFSLSASSVVAPARADSKRQVQNWVWVLLAPFSLVSLYIKHSLVCSLVCQRFFFFLRLQIKCIIHLFLMTNWNMSDSF